MVKTWSVGKMVKKLKFFDFWAIFDFFDPNFVIEFVILLVNLFDLENDFC